MKRFFKYIFMMTILFLPNVVFAMEYVVCGNDRRIPLVLADIFSIVVTAVKILIPVLLVITSMISFFRATISSKVDDELNRAKSRLVNSLIAAVIIFLMVSIVNTIIAVAIGSENSALGCVKCMFSPSRCVHETSDGDRICPGFMNEQDIYDENCEVIEQPSINSDNNTNIDPFRNLQNSTSFDNFLFIGDSRYAGISDKLRSLGNNIDVRAIVGATSDTWIEKFDALPSPNDISGISIMLGVNDLNSNKMKNFLEKLNSKYPNTMIYVNSVYHLGYAYKGYASNSSIDDFNSDISAYCANKSYLKYVDVTDDLYDRNAYLNSNYTSDGLHMNETGNNILVNNIKRKISSYFSTVTNEQANNEQNDLIKVVDGVTYVDGHLIVNKTYGLPKNYVPSSNNKYGLTSGTYKAFEEMREAAKKDGYSLTIVSSYRPYLGQDALYKAYVARDGKEAADRYSARAGHSEHQTGLAFDVNDASTNFHNTPEAKWIADNCYKYGLILRYPEGKEDKTGYMYESWHLRYVGTELAEMLYNKGNWITMEELFNLTSKYSD